MQAVPRTRVSVRVPFCPTGCRNGAGNIQPIGVGSCDQCVDFNKQGVQKQGEIASRLILAEDARLRQCALQAVPLPTSPNKEAKATIMAAQSFMMDCQHQARSGLFPTKHALHVAEDSEEDEEAKQKTLKLKESKLARQQKAEEKKEQKRLEREYEKRDDFQAGLEDEDYSLFEIAKYKSEVICKDAGALGNGVFTTADLKKGKSVSVYDGHRVLKNGKVQLQCPRMMELIRTQPQLSDLGAILFNNAHCITVGCKGSSLISINGAVASHPSLMDLDDHGGIGTGAVINSSMGTGNKPNCIPVWRRRRTDALKNMTSCTCETSHYGECVLVLIEDVAAGQQLFYFYNYHSHRAAAAAAPAPAAASASAAAAASSAASLLSEAGAESAAARAAAAAPAAASTVAAAAAVVVAAAAGSAAVASSSAASKKLSSAAPTAGVAAAAAAAAASTVAPAAGARAAAASAAAAAAGSAAAAASPSSTESLQQFFDAIPGDDLDESQQGLSPTVDDLEAVTAADSSSYTPPIRVTVAKSLNEERCTFHSLASSKVTCMNLKKFVSEIHAVTPSIIGQEFRLSNITNKFSQEQLQQWCVEQADRMRYAREHEVKTQLCARDNVEACMRMLAIFANDRNSRDLYLQSRQVASKEDLDTGALNANSAFWVDMHTKFHDVQHNFLPFPYDHIPTSFKIKTLSPCTDDDFIFPPPDKIAGGLLEGMDLLHGRIPTGFLISFFSRQKLHSLWLDSLSTYRKTEGTWTSSGVALSQPMYHYVLPVTLFDRHNALKTCGVNQATKRWDTIAWLVAIRILYLNVFL